MAKLSIKKMLALAVLVLAGGAVYHYRDAWAKFLSPQKPCQETIYYSLGNFDEKFGISRERFLTILEDAEKGWEDQAQRELFSYSATGTLTINLIYDYRQEATDSLKKAGISIKNNKDTYDSLKARYDSLASQYESKRAEFDEDLKEYESEKKNYEDKVDYWNDRGGAPPEKYDELEKERKEINRQATALNNDQQEINELVESINSTAVVLNKLAKKLNMQVVAYNEVASNTGEEFSEGEYVSDQNGERINVYQFDDNAMLDRLMQHEFGHALGLDHVEDPEAIMYRLNQSENNILTKADIAELNSVCNI